MPKLEEKLEKLGYITNWGSKIKYFSKLIIINNELFNLIIKVENNKIMYGYIETKNYLILWQEDIDEIQEAFNQLQQDLEVLKEYEKLDN